MKSLVLGAAAILTAVLACPVSAVASPTVPHNPQAPAGIGAGQVIVLRPHRADLVRNHIVVRVVPLPGGPVELNTVIRSIGDTRWAGYSGSTSTLDAALLQRPGTSLTIGSPTRTLRLVDSATSPAYLSGSGATITFDGVRVVGVAGSGNAAESVHRPYVRYDRSNVTSIGSTFQALGSRSVAGQSGVDIGTGSTLTATGTTFENSGTGLMLDGTTRATLTQVAATGNASAGIEVNRVATADLNGVTAGGNTTGIVLRTTVPARMDGLVLTRNAVGLDAAGLPGGSVLGPLTTGHDTVAGIALTNCPGCLVRGLTSSGDAIGVRVDARSAGAAVQDSAITGAGTTGIDIAAPNASIEDVQASTGDAATGIHIGRTATGTHVTDGTVTGGATGISIDGAGATITGTTIVNASIGVLVGAHAANAAINHVTSNGATTGLSIDADTGAVTVTGFTARQGSGTGIRSGATNVTLVSPNIDGATVGLDLKGGVTVTGGTVRDAAEAVRVGSDGKIRMTGVDLRAHVLGLRIADSASVTLIRSKVQAPLGARGHLHLGPGTSFPPLPLRWLGVLALVALAFAACLETMRRIRERSHDRSVTAPTHVLNTA